MIKPDFDIVFHEGKDLGLGELQGRLDIGADWSREPIHLIVGQPFPPTPSRESMLVTSLGTFVGRKDITNGIVAIKEVLKSDRSEPKPKLTQISINSDALLGLMQKPLPSERLCEHER